MNVELKRFRQNEKFTQGNLYINHVNICCTLELGWNDNQKKVSCIPNGSYQVKKRNSEKYGDHFHVQNVPNRDMILIHSGNYTSQILGCILVGEKFALIDSDQIPDVTNSKKTLATLVKLLPESFELKVSYT